MTPNPTSTLTRRQLLAALGLAGGGVLGWPRSHASPGSPPLRVLFYCSSHGTVYDEWSIRNGHGDDDDYEISLAGVAPSPLLAPLWDHRDKLIVVDGVGYATALVTDIFAHAAGSATSQSGYIPWEEAGPVRLVAGPSLDQRLGALQDTPFPTLSWGVGTAVGVSYDTLGRHMPVQDDPVAAWARLFPAAASPAPSETAAAIGAGQGSVLDLVAGRYDGVLASLPAEDRAKVALHRDLLRDLEGRVAKLDALACQAPPRPGDPPAPQDAAYTSHQIRGFLDLATVALSCDLTRVITLRVNDIGTATIGAPEGDLHNDIAHAVGSSAAATAYMIAHHRFHAEELRTLLDTLDAIPEGEGTMLDHTIVVWHNELATGNHKMGTVPFVLAGGTGVLRTGRYHRIAPRTVVGGEPLGEPHNKLLNGVARAFGIDDQVGDAEVQLRNGTTLDCTGVLPGLLP